MGLPPSVQMVSNLLGQRADPFLRSSSWAGGSKVNAAEQAPGSSLPLPPHQLGPDCGGGGQVGCWLGASPPRLQPHFPNWKSSLAGLGIDFTPREGRARHSLNASVSDLFLQEKEQSCCEQPSLLEEGNGMAGVSGGCHLLLIVAGRDATEATVRVGLLHFPTQPLPTPPLPDFNALRP